MQREKRRKKRKGRNTRKVNIVRGHKKVRTNKEEEVKRKVEKNHKFKAVKFLEQKRKD